MVLMGDRAAEVAVVAHGAQAVDGVDGDRVAEVDAEVAVVANGAEWSDASDREWGGWDVKHGPSDFARGVTHCVAEVVADGSDGSDGADGSDGSGGADGVDEEIGAHSRRTGPLRSST